LRLRDAGVPSHTLAAELLLIDALGRDRTWLYSHPESSVDADNLKKYLTLIERRAMGEPTQYLTGKQEFWGLEFEVNRAVLIPRPETEHVVEVALERMARRSTDVDPRSGPRASETSRVADVGTGSGCIAVALASELPHAEILATDISRSALAVARRNAARHGVADRIQFVECDLLPRLGLGSPLAYPERSPRVPHHLPPSFDLIASNPPYVSGHDAAQLPREVHDHEPHVALFGGPSGTEIYSRLIEQSASALLPGGILVLELGYNSAPAVRGLLASNPAWTAIAITNDLAGIPRVVSAQRAPASAQSSPFDLGV
jgi:release factor glutamine methyltransferase